MAKEALRPAVSPAIVTNVDLIMFPRIFCNVFTCNRTLRRTGANVRGAIHLSIELHSTWRALEMHAPSYLSVLSFKVAQIPGIPVRLDCPTRRSFSSFSDVDLNISRQNKMRYFSILVITRTHAQGAPRQSGANLSPPGSDQASATRSGHCTTRLTCNVADEIHLQ
jgi:hypothetical protein